MAEQAVVRDRAVAPSPVSERMRLLLEGPVILTLFRLAAPNVLINLTWVAVNPSVDAYFIGRISPAALAGLSLVFPVVMLMQQMANAAMGTSVGSAVARALGAGRREEASSLAVHGVIVGLVMASFFTIAGLTVLPALCRFMGGEPATVEAAITYGGLLLGAAACFWTYCSLAAVIRGTGQFFFLSLTVVAAEAVHVLLSGALALGWGGLPRLGVAGAGIGTVVSFGLGALVLAAYLRSGRAAVYLSLSGVKLRWKLFWEILRVGAPSVVNVTAMNVAVTLFTGFVAAFGTAALTGYGVAVRLEYAQFPLIFGFGAGAITLVGTSVGAGQFARAERVAWTVAATAALITGAIGVAAILFPAAWTGLFTHDPESARFGGLYLRTVAPVYPFLGVSLALSVAFQGAGRPVWPFVANTSRLVVIAGGGWLIAHFYGGSAAALFVAPAVGLLVNGTMLAVAFKAIAWRSP
jgi:putative MATE family efflux protein